MGLGAPHRNFLLPQCEQFVEQHSVQLQSLMARGRDARTTCQVCPPSQVVPLLSSAPTAPHLLWSVIHRDPTPWALDSRLPSLV